MVRWEAIEDVSQLSITGEIPHTEDGFEIRAAGPMLELVLELEQRGMVKEEHSEGRKHGIAQRVFDASRVSIVRKFLESASEQSDYGFKGEVKRLTHGNSLPIWLRQAKPLWG